MNGVCVWWLLFFTSNEFNLFSFRFAGEFENLVDDGIHDPQHSEDSSNDRTHFCEEVEEWHVVAVRLDHEGRDVEHEEDARQHCFSELKQRNKEEKDI